MGIFDPVVAGASAKWPNVGDEVAGIILPGEGGHAYSEQQEKVFGSDQLKFFANGKPAMQAVIKLQTDDRDQDDADDDGVRVVYTKVAQAIAIREALQAAGAKDLEVGGRLAIKYTHDEPSTKGNPTKKFSAKYDAPTGVASIWQDPNPPVAKAAEKAAAPAAKAAGTNGNNGHPDPAADILRIRKMGQAGLEAADINALMPSWSINAITAALEV